jgi:hypothetical protein
MSDIQITFADAVLGDGLLSSEFGTPRLIYPVDNGKMAICHRLGPQGFYANLTAKEGSDANRILVRACHVEQWMVLRVGKASIAHLVDTEWVGAYRLPGGAMAFRYFCAMVEGSEPGKWTE